MAQTKIGQLCCQVNPATHCGRCKVGVCSNHLKQWEGDEHREEPSECGACFNLEEVLLKIQQAIVTDGEYSHNICSLSLRHIARYKGRKFANQVVDDFELTKLFKIPKQ